LGKYLSILYLGETPMSRLLFPPRTRVVGGR